jgi:hypothetical protein
MNQRKQKGIGIRQGEPGTYSGQTGDIEDCQECGDSRDRLIEVAQPFEAAIGYWDARLCTTSESASTVENTCKSGSVLTFRVDSSIWEVSRLS